jgi:acyl dehydratase
VPIIPDTAIGAVLPEEEFTWTFSDVFRYHLTVGAGADPIDPKGLRYLREADPQVLPTFAMTIPAVFGVAASAAFGGTQERVGTASRHEVSFPGLKIELAALLHGTQELIIHRPIPAAGTARVRTRIVDVHDKGSAAVIVQESEVVGADGVPLLTAVSGIFARGEGGFGGERGSARRVEMPEREPDVVLDTPTLPEQALLYQLCGDRNPVHADPSFARAAGYPGPILQGVCTYGMVCKAVVDSMLGSDTSQVVRYSARFTGVVFPGETLRTRVWESGGRFILTTSVVERGDTPVLSDGVITTRGTDRR